MFSDAARKAAFAAARLLGWRPAEFWAATPAELLTALGLDAEPADAPAGQALLARLLQEMPDG